LTSLQKFTFLSRGTTPRFETAATKSKLMPNRDFKPLALLVCATCAERASGEEIAFGYGGVQSGASSSYSWQFDYRQDLVKYTAVSAGYVNEGHLPDHHRDGTTLQFWLKAPPWRDFVFAVGAGPYFYFDTQQTETPPYYRDFHALAGIYTASLTYDVGRHWFVRIDFSAIHAPGNLDTQTLVLGGGYHLDALFDKVGAALADGDADQWRRPINEIGAFGGQSIVNANSSLKSTNFGVEYRRKLATHLQWSAAWISESLGYGARNNGVIAEAWLVTQAFDPRFEIGVGAGALYALQKYVAPQTGQEAARLSGIVSMTVAWRLTQAFNLRAGWSRGFTNDDEDRDIVTVGVGYRWGR